MDLRDMGFPIIVIDEWSSLSEDLLLSWNRTLRHDDGTYRFDWKDVHDMMTVDYSMRLFKGTLDVPDAKTVNRIQLFKNISLV
jgi:hypothetical protein